MGMMEPNPVVLIVEDDADTIQLIRLSLLKSGFGNKVLAVRDGEEAVDYLLGQNKFASRLDYPLPQLILLDLKLPRMDGFEVLKWLRTWPPGQRIPVVVLTNSVLQCDLSSAYAAGANSYLVKGADAHELMGQMSLIGEMWPRGQAKLPVTRP
jgi:CheY-like chemotaxis protein